MICPSCGFRGPERAHRCGLCGRGHSPAPTIAPAPSEAAELARFEEQCREEGEAAARLARQPAPPRPLPRGLTAILAARGAAPCFRPFREQVCEPGPLLARCSSPASALSCFVPGWDYRNPCRPPVPVEDGCGLSPWEHASC